MLNKLSEGPELPDAPHTEVQRRIHVASCIAEKAYNLQTRVSTLCYRFFGGFHVPACTDDSRKEGEGYLYEIDTHLANTVDKLGDLESMIERLEKL